MRNDGVVPANSLAVGVPAVIKPDASSPEMIVTSAAAYVANVHRYREELRVIDQEMSTVTPDR